MELTASLFVGLRFLWKPSTQTVYSHSSCREDGIAICLNWWMSVMCRGSDVKDMMVTSFQLESFPVKYRNRNIRGLDRKIYKVYGNCSTCTPTLVTKYVMRVYRLCHAFLMTVQFWKKQTKSRQTPTRPTNHSNDFRALWRHEMTSSSGGRRFKVPANNLRHIWDPQLHFSRATWRHRGNYVIRIDRKTGAHQKQDGLKRTGSMVVIITTDSFIS